MFIVIHGFCSYDHDLKYVSALGKRFNTDEVIIPKYDSHDANKSAFQLRQVVMKELLDNKDIVLVGVGIGAFWARWLQRQFPDVKTLNIQPEFSPVTALSVKLNTYIDEVGFRFTETAMKAYDKYAIDNGVSLSIHRN